MKYHRRPLRAAYRAYRKAYGRIRAALYALLAAY